MIIAGLLLPALFKARAKSLAAGGKGGTGWVAGGISIGVVGAAIITVESVRIQRYQREELERQKARKSDDEKPQV